MALQVVVHFITIFHFFVKSSINMNITKNASTTPLAAKPRTASDRDEYTTM
jgi:hypothetical protein